MAEVARWGAPRGTVARISSMIRDWCAATLTRGRHRDLRSHPQIHRATHPSLVATAIGKQRPPVRQIADENLSETLGLYIRTSSFTSGDLKRSHRPN
jgi:hypothetical protein